MPTAAKTKATKATTNQHQDNLSPELDLPFAYCNDYEEYVACFNQLMLDYQQCNAGSSPTWHASPYLVLPEYSVLQKHGIDSEVLPADSLAQLKSFISKKSPTKSESSIESTPEADKHTTGEASGDNPFLSEEEAIAENAEQTDSINLVAQEPVQASSSSFCSKVSVVLPDEIDPQAKQAMEPKDKLVQQMQSIQTYAKSRTPEADGAETADGVSTSEASSAKSSLRPLVIRDGQKYKLFLVPTACEYLAERILERTSMFHDLCRWSYQAGDLCLIEPQTINEAQSRELTKLFIAFLTQQEQSLPAELQQLLKQLRNQLAHHLEAAEIFFTETTLCARFYRKPTETKDYFSHTSFLKRLAELQLKKQERLGFIRILYELYDGFNRIIGPTRISDYIKSYICNIQDILNEYKPSSLTEAKKVLTLRLLTDEQNQAVTKEDLLKHCTPGLATKLETEIRDHCLADTEYAIKTINFSDLNENSFKADEPINKQNAQVRKVYSAIRRCYQSLMDLLTDATGACLEVSKRSLRHLAENMQLFAKNSGFFKRPGNPGRRQTDLNLMRANHIGYSQRHIVEANLAIAVDTTFIKTANGVIAVAIATDVATQRIVSISFSESESTKSYETLFDHLYTNTGEFGYIFINSDQTSGLVCEEMAKFHVKNGTIPSLSIPGIPQLNLFAEKSNGRMKNEILAHLKDNFNNSSMLQCLTAVHTYCLHVHNEVRHFKDLSKRFSAPSEPAISQPPDAYHEQSQKRQEQALTSMGITPDSGSPSGLGMTFAFARFWFHRAQVMSHDVNRLLPYAAVLNLCSRDYLYFDIKRLRRPDSVYQAVEDTYKYIYNGVFTNEQDREILRQLTSEAAHSLIKAINKEISRSEAEAGLKQVELKLISLLPQNDINVLADARLGEQIACRIEFRARFGTQISTNLAESLRQLYKVAGSSNEIQHIVNDLELVRYHLSKHARYKKNSELLNQLLCNTGWQETPLEYGPNLSGNLGAYRRNMIATIVADRGMPPNSEPNQQTAQSSQPTTRIDSIQDAKMQAEGQHLVAKVTGNLKKRPGRPPEEKGLQRRKCANMTERPGNKTPGTQSQLPNRVKKTKVQKTNA